MPEAVGGGGEEASDSTTSTSVRVWGSELLPEDDDLNEGAVRVVPATHTALDARVGGIGAARVSVPVYGPER